MTLRPYAQTIYLVLSYASVELTSILVTSYKLRVTALFSSGCRATVESLSSFHSSLQWQSYANCTCHVGKVQAFSFPVIKSYSVVPVFRFSVIPCFPVSRTEAAWPLYHITIN